MSFKALICNRCGGDLAVKDGNLYRCPYCTAEYLKDDAEEISQLLSSMLQADKIERLSNARRVLFDAMNEKYPSENKVVAAANIVLTIKPDDPIALVCQYSYDSTAHRLAEILPRLEVEGNTASEIYRWLYRGMTVRQIGPLKDFVERHYLGKDRTDKLSEIEEEADKINEGIYNSRLRRDVFVAYSSKDMPEVIKTIDLLEENGFYCFAAFRNLRHGRGAKENYLKEIQQAIESCKIFLFVSSTHSRSNDCDAITVELPFLLNFQDKPRIQYVVEDGHTPLLVNKLLKEVFPTQENCRDEEDLIFRVDTILKELKTPKEEEKEEPKKPTKFNYDSATEDELKALAILGDSEARNRLAKLYKVDEKPIEKPKETHSITNPSVVKPIDYNELNENELAKLAQDKKDVKAMLELGYRYEEKEPKVAFAWFKLAADENNIEALCYVGECYRTGKNVIKDLEKARELFSKVLSLDKTNVTAYGRFKKVVEEEEQNRIDSYNLKNFKYEDVEGYANKGNKKAIIEMAERYIDDRTIPVNIGAKEKKENYLKYVKQAAELGFARAQYMLGLQNLRSNNNEEAMKLFKMAADKGDLSSIYELAVLYDSGKTVKKDVKTAIEYYRTVADYKGDLPNYYFGNSVIRLAELYSEGEFKDEKLAEKYIDLGCEKGYEKTIILKANNYLEGDNLEKDIKNAAKFFESISNNNRYKTYCMEALSKIHIIKANKCLEGDNPDYAKAIEHFNKVTSFNDDKQSFNNFIYALLELGKSYVYGTFTEQNNEKAIQLFNRVLNLAPNNEEAQINLAKLHSSSENSKDVNKANQIYENLINKSSDKSTKKDVLSKLEENLIGLNKYEDAIRYCMKSIELGDEKAKKTIDSISEFVDFKKFNNDELTFLADNGIESAQLTLARFYKDRWKEEEAAKYYEPLADKGNQEAIEFMADYHVRKEKRISEKAYKYALQITNDLSTTKNRIIGDCYCCGEYVEKDLAKAKECFAKIANTHDGLVCFVSFYHNYEKNFDQEYLVTQELVKSDSYVLIPYFNARDYKNDNQLDKAYKLYRLVIKYGKRKDEFNAKYVKEAKKEIAKPKYWKYMFK